MEKYEVTKEQIAALVTEMLNEKEEAKVRKNIEGALEQAATTVEELTSELEVKNTEVLAATEAASETESKIQELTSALEAAQIDLTSKDEALASANQTLEDMNKDRAAEGRMVELEDAGVVTSDKESQTAKIREMSIEDFASYRDELVSIRAAVVAELEKAHKAVEADAKAEEEAKAEEKAKADKDKSADDTAAKEADKDTASDKEEDTESASEEGEESTSPANITPGQAAMASLNMEYMPSADVTEKYAAFGEQMAKRMLKKED